MAMTNEKPLISLIVPVFNEEDTILPFYETMTPLLAALEDRFAFEFVFTDNHSTDRTPAIISSIARQDRRVRGYRFSRNFGYQRSVLTGYLRCSGDAAIQVDVDLQDPPELIEVFLREWQGGADVVYGIRENYSEAKRWQYSRRFFYWLVNFLSEDNIPQNAGDFRLISRRVIEELRVMEDNKPYLRGTIATLGFDQVGINYQRRSRTIGTTKFRIYDTVMLALDGIVNQSIVPLRVATYIGIAVSLGTVVAIAGYLIAYYTVGFRAPAGFTTITTLILGSLSINAMLLGILGEYIGRIYLQIKKRSLTIVERVLHDE